MPVTQNGVTWKTGETLNDLSKEGYVGADSKCWRGVSIGQGCIIFKLTETESNKAVEAVKKAWIAWLRGDIQREDAVG